MANRSIAVRKEKQYQIDNRDNPRLHALYFKYAISGILAIDQAIKRIQSEAKTSHFGVLAAIFEERKKLIKEDAAYGEAVEFLDELAEKGLITKAGDCYFCCQLIEE